jgi:hypothetical protein
MKSSSDPLRPPPNSTTEFNRLYLEFIDKNTIVRNILLVRPMTRVDYRLIDNRGSMITLSWAYLNKLNLNIIIFLSY